MLKRLAKTLLPSIAVAAMSMLALPAPKALAQSKDQAETLNTKFGPLLQTTASKSRVLPALLLGSHFWAFPPPSA